MADGAVTLTQSTVSGNSTAGQFADGGGILAGGAVTLTQSTVTDNHAMHASAMGGGVFQFNSASNLRSRSAVRLWPATRRAAAGPTSSKIPRARSPSTTA